MFILSNIFLGILLIGVIFLTAGLIYTIREV